MQKIDNRYMPETGLQACDVVRIVRLLGVAKDNQIRLFVERACRECGWEFDIVWEDCLGPSNDSDLKFHGLKV